jgi:hypothetical protein
MPQCCPGIGVNDAECIGVPLAQYCWTAIKINGAKHRSSFKKGSFDSGGQAACAQDDRCSGNQTGSCFKTARNP